MINGTLTLFLDGQLEINVLAYHDAPGNIQLEGGFSRLILAQHS
jgi:hypothetical protein